MVALPFAVCLNNPCCQQFASRAAFQARLLAAKTKKMQQLTFYEYSILMDIKNGSCKTGMESVLTKLRQKGLVCEVNGTYKIISGASYNYRGNTYKL